MIFENAKYYNKAYPAPENTREGIKVTCDGVLVCVPLDPDNQHYAEILRQVAAGELTIADAD